MLYAKLVFIAISWFYSIFWMSLVLSKKGFFLEGLLISCTFDYLSRDFSSRLIMLSMLIGGFLVPFFIILFFYFLIWRLLRVNSSLGKFYFFSSITKKSLNPSIRSPKTARQQEEEKQNSYIIFFKKEITIVKRIVLMIMTFCVAWLPYTIFVIYGQFGNDTRLYVTPYTTSLPAMFAKSSSIYNPIIYVLTNKECKVYFTKLFMRKLYPVSKGIRNVKYSNRVVQL